MKRTILIVEDQPDVQKLLQLSLQSSERQILPAHNANEAWELLENQHPDVILLDIMMPGEMDGMGLLKKLRSKKQFLNTKVIVISARTQNRDKQAAYAAGADEFICKPFRLEELNLIVERYLP